MQIIFVNPPAQPGRTNERDQSGGIGVSRRLKPGELWHPGPPPLDLLNGASVAEHCGATVSIVDLLLERLSGQVALNFIASHILRQDPDVWIGVRLSIPSLPQDLAFANATKCYFQKATIFVFGSVIMATYRHWITDCRVDFLVYGELEAVLPGLIEQQDWHSAPGIIAVVDHEADGLDPFDERTTADYHRWVKVSDLHTIPYPAWHLLQLERYPESGKASDVVGIIQASRGCPIRCTMCAYTLLEGGPLRKNSAQRVVDEIAYFQDTYGITHFRFRDANFSYDRRLLKAILNELGRRNITIEATAELSLELLDRTTLQAMYDGGIQTILTGVETADPACMHSIGQNIKVNSLIREKIAWCEEIGIKVYTFFLIGAPEESWESIRRTIAFARELGTESTLTLMTPFPGTPLYWRALRENLLPRQMLYERWNSYTATMRTYHLSLRDLTVARLWARLEIIIPYRLKEAHRRGMLATMRALCKGVPLVFVRQLLRSYVWWRSSLQPRLSSLSFRIPTGAPS